MAMSVKGWIFGGLLLLCSAAAGAAAEPGFVVIVNAGNPVSTLSREAAARIFLKRLSTWSSGERTKPVDLAAGSATRESFSRQVLGQSAKAIEELWQKQIYSGRDVPPPQKASEAEVIDYVARTPGAIGYVPAGSPLEPRVKAIRITAER
jgi:ABC-type phosphate transport system substrate-binding protein